MPFVYRRDQILLFLGDLAAFVGGLWVALLVRHFEVPSVADLILHAPFIPLIICWIGVFVTVGLYDRHVALFEQRLGATITEAQIVNFLLALAFFFLAPVAIQPKTVLAIYFVISTALIIVWRLGLFRTLRHGRDTAPAIIIGAGPDTTALNDALCATEHTGLTCAAYLDTTGLSDIAVEQGVAVLVRSHNPSMIIVDPRHHALIASLRGRGADVMRADELYEVLFGRVALSYVDRERFIREAGRRESRLYDALKRVMDAVLAVLLGLLSLFAYPFAALAIKIEDGGGLFVSQSRVGKEAKSFTLIKFRSMSGNDNGEYGSVGKTKLSVTRVGNVLRKTRVDELPQLWSVLLGTQSLVGPRPELPALVAEYAQTIPNYDLRHLVVPGLSGWAQIYDQGHPHNESNAEATARKLSYDLYYIKHRSLILDLDIALKTMKTLVLRLGA